MTLDYIRRAIDAIQTTDAETAHMSEDELHREVLGAIARGELVGPAAAEAAALALTTGELDFPRWYA